MARRLSRRALADFVVSAYQRGDDMKPVVMQLAAHLVETRRTKELSMIVRDVEYALADVGVVSGVVTSAFDLEAQAKQAISDYIASVTKAKTVSLAYQTNPDVIGGYSVALPGKELNHTVSYQLTQLKTRFKKV